MASVVAVDGAGPRMRTAAAPNAVAETTTMASWATEALTRWPATSRTVWNRPRGGRGSRPDLGPGLLGGPGLGEGNVGPGAGRGDGLDQGLGLDLLDGQLGERIVDRGRHRDGGRLAGRTGGLVGRGGRGGGLGGG